MGTDQIERASMDGTNRVVLHSTGLSSVYGLTLDYDTQILYWADSSYQRIEKSFIDGTSREIVTSSGITNPFGITFYSNKLYWTDRSLKGIYTLNLNSPHSIRNLIKTRNIPYGIQAISSERQPQGNNISKKDFNFFGLHLILYQLLRVE